MWRPSDERALRRAFRCAGQEPVPANLRGRLQMDIEARFGQATRERGSVPVRSPALPAPRRAWGVGSRMAVTASVLVTFTLGLTIGHLVLPRQVVVREPAPPPQVVERPVQAPTPGSAAGGMAGGQGGAVATPRAGPTGAEGHPAMGPGGREPTPTTAGGAPLAPGAGSAGGMSGGPNGGPGVSARPGAGPTAAIVRPQAAGEGQPRGGLSPVIYALCLGIIAAFAAGLVVGRRARGPSDGASARPRKGDQEEPSQALSQDETGTARASGRSGREKEDSL